MPMNITAAVIIIGNEILSGRTLDTNLPYLGKRLAGLGIDLREARFVQDLEADIIAAVNACRHRYTYVFTTGGIGPTHDDVTTRSVAQAFNLPIRRDPDAVARLTAYYGQSDLNDARLKMADIPAGAVLIDNPVSSAPGFQLDNVFVLAGIPAIMQAMFEGMTHRLSGGPPILSRTVSTSLIGEGTLAAGLEDLQRRYPQVSIGSYPYVRQGTFGVKLVLRGVHVDALEQVAGKIRTLVARVGGSLLEDD
jgi:molybdopterin-biosynthesis enzyme MoeA-like protein